MIFISHIFSLNVKVTIIVLNTHIKWVGVFRNNNIHYSLLKCFIALVLIIKIVYVDKMYDTTEHNRKT